MTDLPRVTIVFDLDGTLVDSAPDLAGSLDTLLAERGLEPLGLAHGRSLIGHGIPSLVRRGLLTRDPSLDDAAIAQGIERFLAIYADNHSRLTRPYPGAEAALGALRDRGFRLAVATNKIEASARAILTDLKLADRFDQIAGPDTFGAAKPDPRALLGCIPDGHAAVLVGDSGVDLETGRAARVPVIIVGWGYGATQAIKGSADATVETFAEVPGAVGHLLAAPGSTT